MQVYLYRTAQQPCAGGRADHQRERYLQHGHSQQLHQNIAWSISEVYGQMNALTSWKHVYFLQDSFILLEIITVLLRIMWYEENILYANEYV